MRKKCQQCGNKFKNIGSHWNQSSCNYPNFSDYQKEIIVGLLMGDAWLNTQCGRKPTLRCEMSSPNYLEYVNSIFKVLGNGVSLRDSAQQSAERKRSLGDTSAKEENYSDIYYWSTISHPELGEFNWYSSGEKIWPEDIELTSTTLKHLYCGDGSRVNGNQIRISMLNEKDNTEKVTKIFKQSELPTPIRYDKHKTNCNAVFSVEQSEKLWEYMGEPLPDFEYKWPEQYRNTYPEVGRME